MQGHQGSPSLSGPSLARSHLRTLATSTGWQNTEETCCITVLRFHRCALVGNSGLLLQQHAGLAIDKYDAVLRLNNAPTQGFQQ